MMCGQCVRSPYPDRGVQYSVFMRSLQLNIFKVNIVMRIMKTLSAYQEHCALRLGRTWPISEVVNNAVRTILPPDQ